jgi:hypothetical protein
VTGISRRLGTFDTLLMLGNNFGLCGSAVRVRWLLQRFYGTTSERGRLIAESTPTVTLPTGVRYPSF